MTGPEIIANRSASSARPLFPFTAIVGQDAMKRALIFNAIDPSIGGVLISGTRGTAKSTAVRALAALLPEIEVVSGDRFNSAPDGNPDHTAVRVATPFVNLPIGATEDRVLGTLDIERVLKTGERRFEPGLLARANRGVLYVDEVNLLPDHLVDVLLDAVAMGVNRIEREGVSFEHEARVILVGTMNPEEGELRPQLLDRFGLCVRVNGYLEPGERKEVVRRRIAYDADPQGFAARWTASEREIERRIAAARAGLSAVTVPPERLDEIAELCAAARVDGLRADIVIYKTSRAIAAFEGRDAVIAADVQEAQALALAHRRPEARSAPPTGAGPSGSPPSRRPPHDKPPSPSLSPPGAAQAEPQAADGDGTSHAESEPRHFPIGQGVQLSLARLSERAREGAVHGKRNLAGSSDRRGAFVRAIMPRPGDPPDLALAATVLAAALDRARVSSHLEVSGRHWRIKQRRTRARSLIVFVVDASGSMAASARMRAAKGAVCALLEEAYQKRDYVTLIAFHGEGAERLLPPTRSAVFAYRRLGELPAGGRTPLAAGLRLARFDIERQRRKQANLRLFLVLVTDGRATLPERDALAAALSESDRLREHRIASLVIDTETDWLLGQARLLAERLGASYHHISHLPPKRWGQAVREWVAASGAGPAS
ncbi:MAG: VWA domain-containing protein [Gammaproteobacteria bacterium]